MKGQVNLGTLKLLEEGVLKRHPGLVVSLPSDPTESFPRRRKLEILKEIAAAIGEQPVLEAGSALPELGGDNPFLFVLLNSDAVEVLLEKLERWARFIHSRHRERAVTLEKTCLELEHISAAPEPPHRLESLWSCGVVLALMVEIGCVDLTLSFPRSEEPGRLIYARGHYAAPPAGDLTLKRFTWSGFSASRRPLKGLDDALTAGQRPLSDASPTAALVEALVIDDPSRRWRLGDVARKLARSARSLQRDLSEEGHTFSSVVEGARLDLVCRYLIADTLSVTEIAYLCGFSDSAHLARRFRARFDASPTEWRG